MKPPLPQPEDGRLLYVDHLRVFLTALVICHHTAIAFNAAGSWYYIAPASPDSVAPVVLTTFAAINQAFFMSLFFMISAFFTPLSYDKKGPSEFVKDRCIRLGIPLVVYFFLLNPSVEYLAFRFSGNREAYLSFMWENALREAGPGPLWFVFTLLVFAVLYALYRVIRKAPRESGSLPLPTDRKILVFVLLIAVVTFVVRLWCPVGWEIFNLQLGYFPLYCSMYVFGILACRAGWFAALRREQAGLWFRISLVFIVLMPVVMVMGGAMEDGVEAAFGGLTWQAALYALWEPVLCVGISMKLLVLFRERWNQAYPLGRHAVRSAYTAYIIHPFFVVCGTFLLVEVSLPPLVKFVVLAPTAVLSCFFVSDAVRRIPLVRSVV